MTSRKRQRTSYVTDRPSTTRARTMGNNYVSGSSVQSKTKTETHHWGTTLALGFFDPGGQGLMTSTNQAVIGLNCMFQPMLAKPSIQTFNDAHQPLYFDQMAALYRDFEVLSCSYEVIFSPAGKGAGVQLENLSAVVCGVYVHNVENGGSGKLLQNVREAIERPQSSHKLTYVAADNTSTGNAGGPILSFKGEVDIPRELGMRSLGHAALEGTDGGNPTDKMYLVPWIALADPDANFSLADPQVGLNAVVNLTYKARWSQPTQLGQS